MKNIFDCISEKELSNLIGESVKTQVVSENGNSYTCVINDVHIIKVPFNKKTAISLRREINLANILQKCVLPAQTPAWRYVDLSHTSQEPLSKYAAFCAVAPMITGCSPATVNTPELMTDLGRFLAVLHKVPATTFHGVQTYIDIHFNHMIKTWEKQERHKTVEVSRWKHFKKYLKNTCLKRANDVYRNSVSPVLTHADLHERNVLVDERGRLKAVLDFGNAILTPEPQDILFPLNGITRQSVLLNAYQAYLGRRADEPDKSQKTWQLISKMDVQAESILDKFLTQEKQRG
ncbi:MAG: aminoglycoside phosphotransferase family protein [Alphaproteobacteria bacterium]|nr:aminoglycoside phosphotransferase family protein [Alphaproteobacteria bacterium]